VLRSETEFEQIVMPHAAGLLRFARRLHNNGQAAEDLVQETLMLAWRGFRQLERENNARAWLYRILINASYGRGRKACRSPETIPLVEKAGVSSSVLERLEVEQAFAGLSEEQRTVLLLTIVEGFTGREVAEMLSLPLGTVTSRLNRGRQALREVLSGVHSTREF
jgi:RNA polymerase sigma-70 factor, ECF subfamily